VAELESSLKVKRLERDMPKYLRSQETWVQELQQQQKAKEQQLEEGEEISYQR